MYRNILKRIPILMVFALLFSWLAFSVPVSAEAPRRSERIAAGNAEQAGGESGTSETERHIYTEEDMDLLRQYPFDVFYLENDIDMSGMELHECGGFLCYYNAFFGQLHGNGHALKNIKGMLFYETYADSVIENLSAEIRFEDRKGSELEEVCGFLI